LLIKSGWLRKIVLRADQKELRSCPCLQEGTTSICLGLFDNNQNQCGYHKGGRRSMVVEGNLPFVEVSCLNPNCESRQFPLLGKKTLFLCPYIHPHSQTYGVETDITV
jgi:hypothetical protein